MKMKHYLISAAFGVITTCATAQQVQHHSQYMMNAYLINPGAAGTMSDLPIALTFRQQWAGFNDAPITQTLSAHYMLPGNMAVGTIFNNEQTGPLRKVGWQGTFAYHFKVSDHSHIGLGLSAMMQHYTLDQSVLILDDQVDAVINGARQRTLVPDFSFGAYYYGEKHFVGVAAPQLMNMKIRLGEDIVGVNRERPHVFAHGGYRFALHENWVLEPSALVKLMMKAPVNWDLNARVLYQDFVWAGISYRHQDAVVALFGVRKHAFRLGYSYDFTTSNIRNFSGGTHELYLQYTLKLKQAAESSL